MASVNLPDSGSLPPGWTVQFKNTGAKKVKYFCNMQTGQKFLTKEEVLRYAKFQGFIASQEIAKNSNVAQKTDHPQVVVKKIENPEWLPHNWTTELETRESGTKCKLFIDPESGRKFYSKPQVFRYLETVNISKTSEKRHNDEGIAGDKCSLERDVSQVDELNKSSLEPDVSPRAEVCKSSLDPNVSRKDEVNKHTSEPDESRSKEVNSSSKPNISPRNGVSEWLPDGWIVEQRTKGNGKKYKCYVNPETGRTYFSKPQVVRYLESFGSSLASERKSPNNRKVDAITGEKSPNEPDMLEQNGLSEGLPNGWISETKTTRSGQKYKCYIVPESGVQFFSEREVTRYLENINSSMAREMECYVVPESGVQFFSEREVTRYLENINSSMAREMETVDHVTGDGSSSEPRMSEKNKVPEWLPDGWTMVVKTRPTGSTYKIFIDPESGSKFFSKPEVLRYLAAVNNSKVEQEQDTVGHYTGDKVSSENTPHSSKASIIRPSRSASKKSHVDKLISSTPADGLPPGWIKEIRLRKFDGKTKDPYYIDPVSGYSFRSKLDALRYLDTGDISNCSMKPKKRDINIIDDISDTVDHLPGDGAPSDHNMLQTSVVDNSRPIISSEEKTQMGTVISRTSVDGLPPGWIKEIRARNYSNMKDPYYIDPVSGYMFRSKLDALRYLKTGDIASCAMKPKKMSINSASGVDSQELVDSTTRRQLFIGKRSSEPSGVGASEGKEKHDIKTSPEQYPETDENAERDLEASGCVENVSVSTPAINKEAKLTDNNRKARISSNRSNSKPELALPERSSKRLKGLEPEIKGKFMINDQALRAAARGYPYKFDAEPKRERNKTEKHVGTEKQNDEKTKSGESRFLGPADDSGFTDPCLEFAVKTLTGEIPVGDETFQEAGSSQNQTASPWKAETYQKGNVSKA